MRCHSCRSSHSHSHSHWTLSPIQVSRISVRPLALPDSELLAMAVFALNPTINPRRDGGASGSARAPTCAAARPAAAHSFKLQLAPSGAAVSRPFTQHRLRAPRSAALRRTSLRFAALCRAPPTQLPAAASTVQPPSLQPAVRGPSSVVQGPIKNPTPRGSPT